jgi:cytochrome c
MGAGGRVAVLGVLCMGLISCRLAPPPPEPAVTRDPVQPEFYEFRVRPIFAQNCARCHGGFNHKGGLNMDTRAAMLRGGKFGPAIVPGDPEHSLLVRLMRHEGAQSNPGPMPPNKARLSDADLATVEQWIKAGAVMPKP